jgi:lipopolysaccharide export system permease protein
LNLIDRYLLGEWLKMFGLLLAATMGLLVMQALYDNFRDLIQLGVGFGDMLGYYAVLMPSYLSVVLPLSLLLSLLFVLGKLHRNNEITAIRAAGLNIFGTTRALWVAALACCGLTLWLNARVVPWSVEASGRMLDSFELRQEEQRTAVAATGMVNSVAFDNRARGRMWFINRYSRFGGRAFGVTVSELDARRREHTRLLAREAWVDRARGGWVFKDGRESRFDPETGDQVWSAAFAEKVVARFDEDPELMLLIDRKPGELSFFQLQRIVEHFAHEEKPKVLPYAVRYYGVLADTLGPLIILAIAIPFTLSGVRVSPVVGVSKSIGLFFLYYLLNMLATGLGGKGFLDPVWAALLPNLAMVGLATWFFGKMR